jgi:H+/Cl- antiporter ClcA
MKRLTPTVKLLFAALLVGVAVSLVYLGFEAAVSQAIEFVWETVFHTSTYRLLVIPLTIGLGLIYFAIKRFIDTKFPANKQPLVLQFVFVLIIGFFSLFAGASLGPEAILVPSALLLGAITAELLAMKKQTNVLGIAGFTTLFVAFFGSLLGGLLGLYLALKNKPQKLTVIEYVSVALSVLAAFVLLQLLSNKGSFAYPADTHYFTWQTLFMTIALFVLGIGAHFLLSKAIFIVDKVHAALPKHWIVKGLIASAGLAIIFFVGGPLIEFTGNESIVPVIKQAGALGLLGLLGIFILKLVAIAWSKGMGYKGGLIFPMIFVSSTVVAAALLYFHEFSIVVGIFGFLAGAFFADRKVHIMMGGEKEV